MLQHLRYLVLYLSKNASNKFMNFMFEYLVKMILFYTYIYIYIYIYI